MIATIQIDEARAKVILDALEVVHSEGMDEISPAMSRMEYRKTVQELVDILHDGFPEIVQKCYFPEAKKYHKGS